MRHFFTCRGRVQTDDSVIAPSGYEGYRDISTGQPLWGVDLAPEVDMTYLQHLLDLDHPSLAKLWTMHCEESRVLAFLMPLQGQRLDQSKAGSMRAQNLNRIFFELAFALHFLSVRQRWVPHLDLTRIFCTENGQCTLMGHEQAISVSDQTVVPKVKDSRYMAPEVLAGESYSVKSDIYRLGALVYHFLTDSVPRPQQVITPVTQRLRRLKKRWDPLLSSMLAAAPNQRPGWAEVLEAAQSLLRSKVPPTPLVWLGPEDRMAIEQLCKPLLEQGEGASATVFHKPHYPERRRRLNQARQVAVSSGFSVCPVSVARAEAAQFDAINRIIDWLKAHLPERYPDIEWPIALTPFSEWQSARDQLRTWRKHFKPMFQEYLQRSSRGLVIVMDNFDDIDEASIAVLNRAMAWFADSPLHLIACCRSLAATPARILSGWHNPPVQCVKPSPLSPGEIPSILAASPQQIRQLQASLLALDGDETLWTCVATSNDPQAYKAYLENMWSQLTDSEKTLTKVLAVSVKPLSADQVARAFHWPTTSADMARLVRFGIGQMQEDRLKFQCRVWQRFVEALLQESDRTHIAQRLLADETTCEEPDIIQVAFLAERLQTDRRRSWLAQLKHQVFERFDLDVLWRLEDLYYREPCSSFEPFVTWARLVKGEPLSPQQSGNPPGADLGKANRAYARGKLSTAAEHFRRIGGSPKANHSLRCFALLRYAELAVTLKDGLAISKATRNFRRLIPQELHPMTRNMWWSRMAVAATAMEKRTLWLNETADALPKPLRAWHRCQVAWQQGRMREARDTVEEALTIIPQGRDQRWLGQAYKMQGNIHFRLNHPQRAIRSYQRALEAFQQAHCPDGVAHVRYNLATAENLAGRFVTSAARFKPILEEAIEANDFTTQCQVRYNLMVCHLFLNQTQSFEDHFTCLQKIERRCSTPEESLKSLALWLHAAFTRSKDEIKDKMSAMERLLTHWDPFPLLRDEVNVARRFGALAIGQPLPPPPKPYPKLTAWRHTLLDSVTGVDHMRFADLLDGIGNGFFRAYHLMVIRQLILSDWIPPTWRSQKLADIFHKHMMETGAHYSGLLREHFFHLRGLGKVPRQYWEHALQRFDTIPWLSAEPHHILQSLLEGLSQTWPFEQWGLAGFKDEIEGPVRPDQPPIHLRDYLTQIEVPIDREPVQAILHSEDQNQVDQFLLLPIQHRGGAWLWLRRPAHRQHFPGQMDALFRFYAQCFNLALARHRRPISAPESKKSAPIKVQPRTRVDTFGLVGQSQAMQRIVERIYRVGPSDLNTFISGASGTGKELAARAVHRASTRSQQPFRVINCSQYQTNLVESELFGHVRGAFTGAITDRVGALEMADGGTLFIDEIGDIDAKIQSMLLRVIQEGEFSRIGDTRVRKVNIRFVTATNKNLHKAIDRGDFREDLFFRIVEEQLNMPDLAQRLEDLPPLAEHFRKKYAPHRHVQWHHDFWQELRAYHWPGNVREFESYIRKVLLSTGDQDHISARDCLPFLRPTNQPTRNGEATLKEFERRNRIDLLKKRLQHYGGNRTRVAESLGISRQQLSNLIGQYGLS